MDETRLVNIFSVLFPDFSAMGRGDVEAITPILVLIIWAVALVALFFIAVLSVRAMGYIRELSLIFRGVEHGQLWDKRAELDRRAAEAPQAIQDAWREFNETLVTGERRLHNTVPAEEFFNERLVAPSLIGNRGLNSVPAVLTTLGLLGTFIGLTLGLRSLDLGTTPDELRVGIQTLIAGAALGFTASLWGVGTSLIVLVAERIAERRILKRIRRLQERIDGLFELRSPEHSLSEIATSSRESKEALQVLHEKIGSTLQESVVQVSEAAGAAIKESIHSSVAPVMQELTALAANQSAEVFNQVSEDLTAAFRSIGVSLAEQLKESADAMRGTLDYMGERLAQQADLQLEQARTLHEMTSRQLALLDETLPKFVSELERAASTMMGATDGMVSVTSDLRDSAQGLNETGQSMNSMLTSAVSSMSELADTSASAARLLNEQQSWLLGLTEKSVAAAEELSRAASALNGSYDGMRESQRAFLADLAAQLDQHSKAMAGWLSDYGAAVGEQTEQRMDEWNRHTQTFTSMMITATEALSHAIDEIGSRPTNGQVTAS